MLKAQAVAGPDAEPRMLLKTIRVFHSARAPGEASVLTSICGCRSLPPAPSAAGHRTAPRGAISRVATPLA
jgi:hypothetical protein